MYLMQAIFCISLLNIYNFVNSFPFSGIYSNNKNSCGYQSCHLVDSEKITIHLIPHSHDDVGWLKTVDEYYNEDVRPIFNTVIEALKANSDRKFIQVETAYFWLWWKENDSKLRQEFINLLNNGQIEIINGAWSMNDEAASHYQSIIDQFTWGFRILNDTLGLCSQPKIGWQIDPFGHSREHASILTQLGFQGLFFARLDYNDKKRREEDKALEFLWKTSNNLENSYLFSSIFPEFYGSPSGFCWDRYCSDELINEVNVDGKRQEFEERMLSYSKRYRTKNILIPMGGDFHYSMASKNYEGMDKLIQAFEGHEKIQIIYSTPSCYIKAVNEEAEINSIKFPEKFDDFFPYASTSHSYWTGYFTSRPNSKRFERLSNNVLQSAKQLFAFSKLKGNNLSLYLASLREALGVMQHHDAITGTEKDHVVKSYVSKLHKSIKEIDNKMGNIITNLLQKNQDFNISNSEYDFSTCLLANVSVCDSTSNKHFMVAVYNPLSHPVSHYVRLPINDGVYRITGPKLNQHRYELFKSISSFGYLRNLTPKSKELVFITDKIPSMGLNLYAIENISEDHKNGGTQKNDDSELTHNNIFDNQWYFGTNQTGFEIDSTTNKLKSVHMNGKKVEISQEFLYYESSTGDNLSYKPSGAYMFRPETSTIAKPFTINPINLTIQRGEFVDEVKQNIDTNLIQIIRVYKGDYEEDNYIEFDWVVGPINPSVEVITRFTIKDFDNNQTFYTDSNGREMIERVINKRPDYSYNYTEEPISSNYYPVTSKIVVVDKDKDLRVAVLNDRAQGGTSLANGLVELMIHRRLEYDDGYGVSEPLNEIEFEQGVVVRGQHYLILGSSSSNSTIAQERNLGQRKLLQPWVLIANATDQSFQKDYNLQFNGLVNSLPENVHILTFEPWINHTYLLRLEHFLEYNESEELSQPAIVDLTNFFSLCNITYIQEMNLGANKLLHGDDIDFNWQSLNGESIKNLISNNETINLSDISLKPMQIRTFIITTDKIYESDLDPDYNDNAHNGTNSGKLVPGLLIMLLLYHPLFN